MTIDPFTETQSFPGVSFDNVGDIRTIVVRKSEKREDKEPDGTPRTWPDGSAKDVFIMTGESDGETKSLWVRGNLVKAIREALAEAKLNTVVDVELTIKHHALGDKKPGMNQAKLYKVKARPVAPPVADPFANDASLEPF